MNRVDISHWCKSISLLHQLCVITLLNIFSRQDQQDRALPRLLSHLHLRGWREVGVPWAPHPSPRSWEERRREEGLRSQQKSGHFTPTNNTKVCYHNANVIGRISRDNSSAGFSLVACSNSDGKVKCPVIRFFFKKRMENWSQKNIPFNIPNLKMFCLTGISFDHDIFNSFCNFCYFLSCLDG